MNGSRTLRVGHNFRPGCRIAAGTAMACRQLVNPSPMRGRPGGASRGRGVAGLFNLGVVKRGQPGSDASHNGAEGLESLSLTHATECEVRDVQGVGEVTQGVGNVVTS